ncbi:MAG TPA: VOC family protein [Opitutaceae bacterium]|nr:VOC family protein [Opitutaceae bacterium]
MKTISLIRITTIAAMICGFSTLPAQPAPTEPAPANVSDYPEKGMVPQKRMLHIGIVVRDIEKSRERWMKFLGLEKLPDIQTATGDAKNPTEYRGHPSTAQAKLVFMNLDNLQVELIEPIGDTPSHWREFLDSKGEGVHHIAFAVKGMGEAYLEKYAEAGCPVVQHGGWATGEYGYMDTAATLGVTVELIENYTRK